MFRRKKETPPYVMDGELEERSIEYSISNPAFAAMLNWGGQTLSGEVVNEFTALGLSAFYRGLAIVSGTIAGLPLKSYRTNSDGTRVEVDSILDDPFPFDGMTQFEWKELIVVHILLFGNAYLRRQFNGAGILAGLQILHPSCVQV